MGKETIPARVELYFSDFRDAAARKRTPVPLIRFKNKFPNEINMDLIEGPNGQLLIVHLTDLHIQSDTSIGKRRLEAIAGAIGSTIEGTTTIVLVISGDLAYAGTAKEYDIIGVALAKLSQDLRSQYNATVIPILVPGNHDCDFATLPDAVQEALLSSPDLEGDRSGDIVAALAPLQNAYFSFATSMAGDSPQRRTAVVSELRLTVAARTFRFILVNTSWCSRLHEKPGSLRMPRTLLPNDKADAELCIVVAHHPLNWFTPKDAQELSEWLDSTADLVLWGHEHRFDDFTTTRNRLGSTVNYKLGLPMEDKSDPCGFRSFRLDLTAKTLTEFEARFPSGSISCSVSEIAAGGIPHNEHREHGLIRFTKQHLSWISDPGATFSHPRLSRPMTLNDIFVPPDLREFRSDKLDIDKIVGSYTASDIAKLVRENEGRFVIFGGEQSGKTTLAKELITRIRHDHLTPIFLDAAKLKSTKRGEIRGWLKAAILDQYMADCIDAVSQNPPSKVVVLIDNVHAIPGNVTTVTEVLRLVEAKSLHVIFLTSENPAFSILAASEVGDEDPYLRGAQIFELLPMGHKRRGELIRRWVSLGRDETGNAEQIEGEVRQIKRLLDRVFGRHSLPKYPLFVLALLQQLEGLRDNRTAIANGSHGYLFEALITQALDRYVRSHEIGTVHDFLAALAHALWLREETELSHDTFSGLIARFRQGLVEIDGEALLRELSAARMMISDDSSVRFRYQYLYYYYLAKWIVAHSASDSATDMLNKLCEYIHTEQSSNVLMFVAHLGHEAVVVDKLLPIADGLFHDHEPCKLEQYSDLSLKFRTPDQRAFLFQGHAADISDEHNSREDTFEKSSDQGEQEEGVEEGIQFNTALKIISTLGQVLKSRASSLSPERKVEIADSVMLLSRRLMTVLYGATSAHAETLVRMASEAVEKKFNLPKQDAAELANRFIGAIVLGIARICVGRASEAIASFELRPLLEKLNVDRVDDDSKLILLCAELIANKTYPKAAVEQFVHRFKPSNVLPLGVMAGAVARRFYLEPPERHTRDSACELLGIDVKRLPRGGKRY